MNLEMCGKAVFKVCGFEGLVSLRTALLVFVIELIAIQGLDPKAQGPKIPKDQGSSGFKALKMRESEVALIVASRPLS